MIADLYRHAWPARRAAEAVEALARRAHLLEADRHLATAAAATEVAAVAAWLGIVAEPAPVPYAGAREHLAAAAPALIALPEGGHLALVRVRAGRALLLRPDGTSTTCPLSRLVDALRAPVEAPHAAAVGALLSTAGIEAHAGGRAREAMISRRVGAAVLGSAWTLRLSPGAAPWRQVRHARLGPRLGAYLAVEATEWVLFVASWAALGKAAFDPDARGPFLLLWVALLLALLPVRALGVWLGGRLAVDAGRLLRRRLLHGALALEPEETRGEGTGALLGRVLEVNAVEALAVGGGLGATVALLELAAAGPVLAHGAGGMLLVTLLAGWAALCVLLGWGLLRTRRAWTTARLGLTHDLVERLLGHRTRLAQQPPEHWHDGEAAALAGYAQRSVAMDRRMIALLSVLPRGWLLASLACLVAVTAGRPTSPVEVAISLGGIILASQALGAVSAGAAQIAGAVVACNQVAPLWRAASRTPPPGRPSTQPVDTGAPMLAADDVGFAHPGRATPVLTGADVAIHDRDRLLLTGPSGCGKSTLASLLGGLRTPATGRITLRGRTLDQWGSYGWRRQVGTAPQFHENHLLLHSLAFNLLMGRRWPPQPGDLELAHAVCEALGLGPTIDAMPAGLGQIVGETGWQLSHGERSLVFLARTLLSGADVLLLDETFGSLDPATAGRALHVVTSSPKTVLAIRH